MWVADVSPPGCQRRTGISRSACSAPRTGRESSRCSTRSRRWASTSSRSTRITRSSRLRSTPTSRRTRRRSFPTTSQLRQLHRLPRQLLQQAGGAGIQGPRHGPLDRALHAVQRLEHHPAQRLLCRHALRGSRGPRALHARASGRDGAHRLPTGARLLHSRGRADHAERQLRLLSRRRADTDAGRLARPHADAAADIADAVPGYTCLLGAGSGTWETTVTQSASPRFRSWTTSTSTSTRSNRPQTTSSRTCSTGRTTCAVSSRRKS